MLAAVETSHRHRHNGGKQSGSKGSERSKRESLTPAARSMEPAHSFPNLAG